MFRDAPWAPAKGSFGTPVVPPSVDPDASPNRTFTISCQWLPFIRGALLQLLLQATWKAEGDDLTLAQQRAMTLISMFDECSQAYIPFACQGDFRDNASPFSTWSLFNNPPTIGAWISTVGYQSTISILGSSAYNGILLKVHLANPCVINDVSLLYDLNQGQVNNPSELAAFAYDLDNAAFLSGAVTFAGISIGLGEHLHFGGPTSPTQNLLIRLFASSSPSTADPSPAGLCDIIGVNITGSNNGFFQCE